MELNCDVQKKRKISDLRPIASIDTQLRIYYEHAEIGTDEVRTLFGQNISDSTVSKLKKLARAKMVDMEVQYVFSRFCVNTEAAYAAWGIDVNDLERRKKKLAALKLLDA